MTCKIMTEADRKILNELVDKYSPREVVDAALGPRFGRVYVYNSLLDTSLKLKRLISNK